VRNRLLQTYLACIEIESTALPEVRREAHAQAYKTSRSCPIAPHPADAPTPSRPSKSYLTYQQPHNSTPPPQTPPRHDDLDRQTWHTIPARPLPLIRGSLVDDLPLLATASSLPAARAALADPAVAAEGHRLVLVLYLLVRTRRQALDLLLSRPRSRSLTLAERARNTTAIVQPRIELVHLHLLLRLFTSHAVPAAHPSTEQHRCPRAFPPSHTALHTHPRTNPPPPGTQATNTYHRLHLPLPILHWALHASTTAANTRCANPTGAQASRYPKTFHAHGHGLHI
jgi:hypothetical protein